MRRADRWKDYELLDAGGGEKLERWGDVVLRRPDPQAIWPAGEGSTASKAWNAPNATYHRSETGGGFWEKHRVLPSDWTVSYPLAQGTLTFRVEPTGFKHTGLFPEQAVNWDVCAERISEASSQGRPCRILNLFAYTGGATAACAKAGATEVVHVDASKGMNQRAKENLTLSGCADRPVRFITDDVGKFVEREIRRGRRYDGIIMDPPSYGRGPAGELWKLEDALYPLVEQCAQLLSDTPSFFLINAYTTGLSPAVLSAVLSLAVGEHRGGRAEADEIGLPASLRSLVLPCGASGWWTP
jgi:23S rRNA (cytosine1962-C5)-methyltransferase